VYCLQPLQRDVNCAIDRCAGARQHTDDSKRTFAVQSEAHFAGAVRDDDFSTPPVLECLRDIRAKHRVLCPRHRSAAQKGKRAALCKAIVLKVRWRSGQYTESPM